MDELPIISASLLRDSESGCGLRVVQRWERAFALHLPFGPARVRNPFVDQLRELHGSHDLITPELLQYPEGLTGEELAVFARARDGYCTVFADAPAHRRDVAFGVPTVLPRRKVAIGAPIDLALTAADGMRELRLLFYGSTQLIDRLEDDVRVRLAVLRMAVVDGPDAPVRISAADVLNGDVMRWECTPSEILPALGEWLDEQIAAITQVSPQPHRGTECTRCQFVHTCPAIADGAGG
ncbi:MAG: hypothetical protein ACOYN3_06640, partial [Acidimicrobiia bacterium]